MGMVLRLDRACFGKWGSVVEIDTSGELKARLRDFGLVPGTKVCRRYCSPGGDVTAIELRGSVLALRTRDLEKIRVRIG